MRRISVRCQLLLMIERVTTPMPSDLSFDVNYIKNVLLKNTKRENVSK